MSKRGWILLGLVMVLVWGTGKIGAEEELQPEKSDPTKSRLVMIKLPQGRISFFGLPLELPLLLSPGENLPANMRQYDFSRGMEAMQVFLVLRPQDPLVPAYRRFLKKWPLYQAFFKALDEEEYTQAQEKLDNIKTIDPQEPAVYFYQGSLNTQLKQYLEAEKNYRKCIQLLPTYAPAYINLARLVKARGDIPQARQYLQSLLQSCTDPDQKDARVLAQKMLESIAEK